MWRLVKLCGFSLLIYWGIFGWVVDRPLSLGILRLELLRKAARMADMPSPKLVVLAGSNGPYSHSCVVLSAMLNLPCENAGIAVGIGLDDIFARYEPLLHAGDIVYMPMELKQYTETARAYDAGVDGAFLIRHDRKVLLALPWRRQLGASFCCTIEDLIEALMEMPLASHERFQPKIILSSEYNKQGDRIDNRLAGQDKALLAAKPRKIPSVSAIKMGYGTKLISLFVAHETRRGVIVIGGMPVDYDTMTFSQKEVDIISQVYTANGGIFMILPNQSHYPRADFFNGEDHLARPCQYMHSIFVAEQLGMVLRKHVVAAPETDMRLAGTCPSAIVQFASNLDNDRALTAGDR